jgi:hypothetical protein
VAMETAINTINSQKQYLNSFFNTTSSAATTSQTSQASGL